MNIEERAKEYACQTINGWQFSNTTKQKRYNNYIEIATDQQKIDIEKAWKWIENFMKVYGIDDPTTPNEDLFEEAMEE